MMLAIWSLAITHCDLERVAAFAWLQCCCASEEPAKAPANDCAEAVCGSVETGMVKSEESDAPMAAPVLCLVWKLPGNEADLPNHIMGLPPLEQVPPELARIWQFKDRAALPPRAPSFLS